MKNNKAENKRSLLQLLLFSVCGVLFVMLLGNLILNAMITRGLIQEQLHAHARDAATSLGLSLSTVIDARDTVLAGRMIDAIYDSGDFKYIVYRDNQGEVLHATAEMKDQEVVPAWFRDLVSIELPEAKAQVMAGWGRLGELEVYSRTDIAYSEMWQAVKTQFLWFFIVLLLAVGLILFVLSRILRPLKEVEAQAHEMSNKNFDYRLVEPDTRELSKVARAMNEMAERLGSLFRQQLTAIEVLREQSLLDELTGLHNREGFDRRLKVELESLDSVKHGVLMLLKVNDFQAVNQSLGRQQADELLVSVSEILRSFVSDNEASFAARRTGADFSVFLPNMVMDAIDAECGKLMAKLSSLTWVRQLLRDDILHLGVAAVGSDDDVGRLLSKADMALQEAQGKGVSGWQRYASLVADEVSGEVREANHWHSLLQEALASRDVSLYAQDVCDPRSGESLYRQVLARLQVGGELVPAGVFIPMAKRFNLMVELDRLIVGKVLEFMRAEKGEFSLSLSEAAVIDLEFMEWLEQSAKESEGLFSRLHFQVPEYLLSHSEDALQRLSGALSSFGASLVIERFGVSSVPFSYLQRLNIDTVKVDHSFVREIQNNTDSQFFMRSVIQLAHSQGVKVVAVGVESESEMVWLRDVGVDGAMGYHLGQPAKIV